MSVSRNHEEHMIKTNEVIWYRIGTVLVWLGVLVWTPYLYLRAVGESPSLLWFLPFHLIGVVGGSRLRKMGNDEVATPARSRHKSIGHGLLALGIAVWVPYFTLKYGLHQPVDVGLYLPFHLLGVLSGAAVLIIGKIRSK